MNELDPPGTESAVVQIVESSRHRLLVGLVVIAACTFLLLSEAAPTLGFVGAVLGALFLLAMHSITLRIDEEQVEVRLGNGWRRHRVALASIVEVHADRGDHVDTASSALRRRRFSAGGAETVVLTTADERIEIAVDDATDVAATILARRARALVAEGEANREERPR